MADEPRSQPEANATRAELVPPDDLPAPRWEELPGPLQRRLAATCLDAEDEFARAVDGMGNLLERRVRDVEHRREVWSLTWLAFLRALDGFNPARGTLAAWTWGICTNVISRFFERPLRPLDPLPEGYEHLFVDPASSPEQILLKTEQAQVVQQALDRVSSHYREVLVMIYFDGLSYSEVAQELGLKRNQVAQRARDGLRAFCREYLRLQGETDATL